MIGGWDEGWEWMTLKAEAGKVKRGSPEVWRESELVRGWEG